MVISPVRCLLRAEADPFAMKINHRMLISSRAGGTPYFTAARWETVPSLLPQSLPSGSNASF